MNEVNVKRGRGIPKKTWRKTIREYMTYMTIEKHMVVIEHSGDS